ncbi:MAG: OmpA family protein [Gemmobacter sp.]|nr:OmpA family protein [Gemmobacter sp.]
MPSTITFPFNSAQLTTEARRALDHQANWMRQFPELRFSVYGHTDLVGSEAYNRALGKRRAQAVVAYLASRGVSTSRLEALVSYGETRPVIVTLAPEQRNRRTVTEVSGFAQGSQDAAEWQICRCDRAGIYRLGPYGDRAANRSDATGHRRQLSRDDQTRNRQCGPILAHLFCSQISNNSQKAG